MGRSMIMSILYFIGNILSVVVLTPLTAVQDSSYVFHSLPAWILKTFLLHLAKENCFFMINLFCVLKLYGLQFLQKDNLDKMDTFLEAQTPKN